MRERILANIPRSNNAVEGYHNAVQSSVSSVHPNLWKLCGALAKEEAMAQAKIAHFRRGDSVKRKKKYEVIDKRLKKLVEGYKKEDFLIFLTSVAHNLHSF